MKLNAEKHLRQLFLHDHAHATKKNETMLAYNMLFLINDELNGSVDSIADLIPKGPGFESSHKVFPLVKEVEDICVTNRPRKRSKYV
jgi:hypothetical protein